jgi:Flp pilus assembly CpaE family ATPase
VTEKHLLLIEPDRKTASFLHHMLSQAGYEVTHSPSGKEGLIAAWRDQPEVIITEIELPDIDATELIQKLRGDLRTASSLLIGLTANTDPAVSVRAKEAGVSHIVVKQTDAVDMLLRVLGESAPISTGPIVEKRAPPPGELFVFLGVKGGTGTSSLCLNIANQIAQSGERSSVVVIDLALPIGSLTRITGAEAHVDLVHLTQVETKQLSANYIIEGAARPQAWGFTLIPGSTTPQEAAALNTEHLASLLQIVRGNFGTTIVDLGRTLSQISLLVMSQADQVFLVLIPDQECVFNTLAIRSYLKQQGVPPERVALISNRPIPSEGLTTPDLETRLGQNLVAAVPNFGSDFQLANTLHAPLQLRFPDARVTDKVRDISRAMLEMGQQPT